MNKFGLLHAYLVHRRDFRDSSLIVHFFTKENGMISAIAKGAKRPNSKFRFALHFFTPLLINFYGKAELAGLRTVEFDGMVHTPQGKVLLTLLYVNELLTRLLQKEEPHPMIFSGYEVFIKTIMQNKPIEPNLRKFEALILQDLGYGLSLNIDSKTGKEVLDEQHYQFLLDEGIFLCQSHELNKSKLYLSGAVLKQIQDQDFSDKNTLLAAKLLFRQIFNQLLQFKPLNSRQLFIQERQDLCVTKF